jgi:uncharacterized protein (TIGR03435 family)
MIRSILCRAALFSSLIFSGNAFAQSFGTADIRASAPNTIPRMRVGFSAGRYEIRNATLVDMIQTAWNVDTDNVLGGPEWLDTSRFDLIGTAPNDSSPETLRIMLQGFLKDRFQLRAHAGNKDLPAYTMTAGKKPQIKPSEESTQGGCTVQAGTILEPVVFRCKSVTMADFAKDLPTQWPASNYLFKYPVVDRTGLRGAWDFTFECSRPPSQPAPAAVAKLPVTTLFDAFENQLGLKLELTRAPMPVVVVESARPPEVTTVPARRVEFEVADIRPDAPGVITSNVGIQPGGRVTISMTLQGLIWEAWGNLNPDRIIPEPNRGGPKNINSTGWVVVAKAPVEQGPVIGWNGVDINSMRQMLRSLLEDRFHLVAHEEDRLVDGYALVTAKPKLKKADPSNRPGCRDGPGAEAAERNWKDPRIANPMAPRLVTCRNMTLAQFVAELSKPTAEDNPILLDFPPIVNATGLDGRYDMTINFSPPPVILGHIEWKGGSPTAGAPAAGGQAPDPDGTISIFEALEKQLGLKLESRKVTGRVLVIEHLDEKPAEN